MPFENCLSKVYSESSVMQNAPAASGVFGLSNAQGWLVIGESDDIRDTLLNLLEDNVSKPGRRPATGFSYEVHPPQGRIQRRDRLIQELKPRQRVLAGDSPMP
jgi:hypothetical protein